MEKSLEKERKEFEEREPTDFWLYPFLGMTFSVVFVLTVIPIMWSLVTDNSIINSVIWIFEDMTRNNIISFFYVASFFSTVACLFLSSAG